MAEVCGQATPGLLPSPIPSSTGPMDRLPDELIAHILSYLEPVEILVLQCVSRRFLKLGRDGPLWRFQCYHDSPQATAKRLERKSWSQALAQAVVGHRESAGATSTRIAGAADKWDLSDASERVDWYSEYIARHAELSAGWLSPEAADYQDVKGVALYQDRDGQKLVTPLGDGSLTVWHLEQGGRAPGRHSQIGGRQGRSEPGLLLKQSTTRGDSSRQSTTRSPAFTGITDGVSVDVTRQRAYVAVGDVLNEVDLNRLEVVSQTSYAWTITAVSEMQNPHQPLTVGTTLSLHILDPRSPSRDCSGSGSASTAATADLEDSIAFFQPKNPYSFTTRPALSRPSSLRDSRWKWSPFAEIEPAPLSILHQAEHSILAAGRFPSILNYDRRYFPRLSYVIHSGARLSALAYLPFPFHGGTRPPTSSSHGNGTLISCGEYNGRGSLELYSIPHLTNTEPESSSPDTTFNTNMSQQSQSPSQSQAQPGTPGYRNRQTASSSKLLSLATQGSRIVISDADGGLKWMERDGRSVVRKWNINHPIRPPPPSPLPQHRQPGPPMGAPPPAGSTFTVHCPVGLADHDGDVDEDQVIRKLVPTGPAVADDLLIWTGERIGLVSFGSRQPRQQQQQQQQDSRCRMQASTSSHNDTYMEANGDDDDDEVRAREYDRQMRRALERQTDEVNWMRRFGAGGGVGPEMRVDDV